MNVIHHNDHKFKELEYDSNSANLHVLFFEPGDNILLLPNDPDPEAAMILLSPLRGEKKKLDFNVTPLQEYFKALMKIHKTNNIDKKVRTFPLL